MQALLFLTHRIPYPPNKGDKIRSFNLLKHLTNHYRVHLGSFVDDKADWGHKAALGEMCQDVFLLGLEPRVRKLISLSGLVTGSALSIPYYWHHKMADWVQRKLGQEGIEKILVFSSPMAQYVLGPNSSHLRRVIDFVDVDSEKWRQYSARHYWPMNWLYAREGRRLLSFERSVSAEFDASVFVTKEEAGLFRRLSPDVADKVTHISNGVDTDFFSPDRQFANPYAPRDKVLVFTGAMDYWANEDAVCWFAHDVFPQIHSRVPEAKFYIVGARPAPMVRRLKKEKGVHVTGAVKDVRPYLAHAQAAVAPMRIARGVQNKVLEAMAMSRPVLASRMAMDGIDADGRMLQLVSDDAATIAHRATELLTQGDAEGLGTLGRDMVKRKYAWSHSLKRLETLLQDSDAPLDAGSVVPGWDPGATFQERLS